MKVERWEEESDEDWAERLAEEITLANNTETTKYFVERDPYDEEEIIIHYIGETGWTWKEHPEGPFKVTQILEWKNTAEKLPIYEKQFRHMTEHALELEEKLEAVRGVQEELEEWRSLGFEESWAKADPHDVLIKVDDELTKILEDLEFTTKDDPTIPDTNAHVVFAPSEEMKKKYPRS